MTLLRMTSAGAHIAVRSNGRAIDGQLCADEKEKEKRKGTGTGGRTRSDGSSSQTCERVQNETFTKASLRFQLVFEPVVPEEKMRERNGEATSTQTEGRRGKREGRGRTRRVGRSDEAKTTERRG